MRMASLLPLRRVTLAFVATLALAPAASGQLRRTAGTSLTDAEFWEIFSTMSEPGGTFASENFVSNEMSFQYVIPTLQRTVRSDGVYLGVGPEQNFTYIANLKPRLAIIFDIRRQNAMAHLMYKAIFEMSPTRGDFVGRLFSRPLAGRVAATAQVGDLFAVATAAARNDSAYAANSRAIFATLVDKHRFALTPGDSAAIEHLLEVFYEAGPDINYGYRLGRRGTSYSTYPTYGTLQTLTNVDSVPMAFLASEENYRAVREMHLRNLIVPVVGDFAGPKAIRAVGEYLKQRSLTVSAFYLSNVEQYLFQNGVADRFYENVATLPIDSTSTFIRSVPPGAGGVAQFTGSRFIIGGAAFGSASNVTRVEVSNLTGRRTMTITQDSGGLSFTRTYWDSAGTMVLQGLDTLRGRPAPGDTALERRLRASAARQDSIARLLTPVPSTAPYAISRPSAIGMGGSLVSGIGSISKTIAEHKAGTIFNYRDIIAMTKLDGWK